MSTHGHSTLLSAHRYNQLLVDHEATSRVGQLKDHVPRLMEIIRAHGLEAYVEPHLLHRHFLLEDGEAIVHHTLQFEMPDDVSTRGEAKVTIDVAKATLATDPRIARNLSPIMWMTSGPGLLAFEYLLQVKPGADPCPERMVHGAISPVTWREFGKQFADYVAAAGLGQLAALKDRSCVAGPEYTLARRHRALVRVPKSIVRLQADGGLIETGWAPPIPAPGSSAPPPEPTDGHVTRTRQTKGGTVAHYHEEVDEVGPHTFDPEEIDPAYTAKVWELLRTI